MVHHHPYAGGEVSTQHGYTQPRDHAGVFNTVSGSYLPSSRTSQRNTISVVDIAHAAGRPWMADLTVAHCNSTINRKQAPSGCSVRAHGCMRSKRNRRQGACHAPQPPAWCDRPIVRQSLPVPSRIQSYGTSGLSLKTQQNVPCVRPLMSQSLSKGRILGTP
jgi:hypothetical protein